MFTNNLIQYHINGNLGKCPQCGKPLKISVYKTPIRDNCTIECSICKKSEYFTGSLKNQEQK